MNKVVRAIILDKAGRILLGKRARGYGEGLWALVGGKPEEGESFENAIRREVREELGVDFIPRLYKEEVDSRSDPLGQPWQVCFFVGEIQGELHCDPAEISEMLYISRDNLSKLDIAFNHKEILEEYFNQKL